MSAVYNTIIASYDASDNISQVSTFSKRGLSTTFVCGETLTDSLLSDVSDGVHQLVFFSPEIILQGRKWREVLGNEVYSTRLKGLVIDEAHCVKKW